MKNGTKIKKKFENWHANEISRFFHILRDETNEGLRAWLDVSGKIPEKWQNHIENLRKKLVLCNTAWNETELMTHFIIPFLFTLEITDFERGIQEFGGRSLSLPDDTYEIKGIVDWMVASARADFEPQTPYFFIHEYKRFRHNTSDPLGQLLIAMLAAQRANNDGLPIYGAWIMGAIWKFVLLDGNVYAESKAYDAVNEGDLTEIWLILEKTKRLIYARVENTTRLPI